MPATTPATRSSEAVMALCACGCGQETKPASATMRNRGWVAGQPLRYVLGHNMRGVVHPRVPQTKTYRTRLGTRLHVFRAERALGRPLPLGAEVHHGDGSKSDNSPLVICQDHAYHMLLHVRMRVLRAGGNPNTQRICQRCATPKLLEEFTASAGMCRDCQRAANAQWRQRHSKETR
jgi:hypothetical protein